MLIYDKNTNTITLRATHSVHPATGAKTYITSGTAEARIRTLSGVDVGDPVVLTHLEGGTWSGQLPHSHAVFASGVAGREVELLAIVVAATSEVGRWSRVLPIEARE